jgi:hypothetical protein
MAVEVKTLQGFSDVGDLEQAVGQHAIYRLLLEKQEPERVRCLGVPEDAWNTVFAEPLGQAVCERLFDRIVRFDPRRAIDPPKGLRLTIPTSEAITSFLLQPSSVARQANSRRLWS